METKDWEEALYAVIPKRKYQSGGTGDAEEFPTAAGSDMVEGEGTVDEVNAEEDSDHEAIHTNHPK